MITIKGRVTNRVASVQWDNGKLSGDDVVTVRARALVIERADVCATVTGPCVSANLATLPAALWTIYAAFDEVLEVTGAPEFDTGPVEMGVKY